MCIIKLEEIVVQLKEKGEKERKRVTADGDIKYKVEDEMMTGCNERGLCIHQSERNERRELMLKVGDEK